MRALVAALSTLGPRHCDGVLGGVSHLHSVFGDGRQGVCDVRPPVKTPAGAEAYDRLDPRNFRSDGPACSLLRSKKPEEKEPLH